MHIFEKTAAVLFSAFLTAALSLGAGPALGQTPPDAGRILRDTLHTEVSPASPSVELDLEGQPLTEVEPGGAEIMIKDVFFTGNSVFDRGELLAVIEDAIGKAHDLAGLRHMANRISLYYRQKGYAFAYAYVPEQKITDGRVRIDIIEGRYGRVYATGDPELASWAERFLGTLRPKEVIEMSSLERALLILGDQPGVEVSPVLRPGDETGTGDLDVNVERGPRVSGRVRFDNHGNRYSGQYRGDVLVRVNRLFAFGDQFSIRGLYTDENLWLGEVNYGFALGGSGLRGYVGYAHTAYDLGFPYEGFTGVAKVASAGLSYPIIRSSMTNVTLFGEYRHKRLDDELLDVSYDKKSSDSVEAGVRFDGRDDLWGGGITYGMVSVTAGDLDADTPGSLEGSFTRANVELNRLQNLPGAFSMFLSASGQFSGDDLDSSESFSLGGADGVRAYPRGEASGSEGWLTTAEMRYATGNGWEPYVFYDAGHISGDTAGPGRSLSGAGLGVRYRREQWRFDASASWKVSGGDPTSDDRDRSPRIWVSLVYSF
jgi:hemolysin activation/secretion protein